MIKSPKGNRTDVSGVIFPKSMVLYSNSGNPFCQKWIMNGVVAGAVKIDDVRSKCSELQDLCHSEVILKYW